jgi:hypothetical protein
MVAKVHLNIFVRYADFFSDRRSVGFETLAGTGRFAESKVFNFEWKMSPLLIVLFLSHFNVGFSLNLTKTVFVVMSQSQPRKNL